MNRSLELKSLKIACDVDGVVSDFAGPFLKFFNEHTHSGYSMDVWTEWSLVESLSWKDAERRTVMQGWFDRAFKQYCDEDRFKDQPEIGAGWAMVHRLNDDGHNIVFFTHRSPKNAPIKLDGYDVLSCTDPQDKAIKAVHWGAKVFIDDRSDNYLEARKAGIELVILWATPYNAAFRERQVEKGDICVVAGCYDDVKALMDKRWAADAEALVLAAEEARARCAHCGMGLPPRGAVQPVIGRAEWFCNAECYGKWCKGVECAAGGNVPVNPMVLRFDRVYAEWRELMIRKNHDYAGDNGDPFRNLKMCEACGIPAWQGVVVRLTDKMSRLQSFMRQGTLEVKDESVIDTFDDLGIYAVLGRLLFEESQNAKHAEG